MGGNLQQQAGGVGGLMCVTDYKTQIPVVSYPTYDGNGNITEYLTEENQGTISAHFEYDTFGNVTKKAGITEYEYQFSTKPYDLETELNYYNYRNYDSTSGRWLNRDAIEENGGNNLYVFLNNTPTALYDFLGFLALTDDAIGGCYEANVTIEVKLGWFFSETIDWKPGERLGRKITRMGMAIVHGKWSENKSVKVEDVDCPCSKIKEAYEAQKLRSLKISVELIFPGNNRQEYRYPGGFGSKTFAGVFHPQELTWATGGTAYGQQALPLSSRSTVDGLHINVYTGDVDIINGDYYL